MEPVPNPGTRKHEVPAIVFLTGASGSGKTTLLDELRQRMPGEQQAFLHFDSVAG
jgi:uridine kinase